MGGGPFLGVLSAVTWDQQAWFCLRMYAVHIAFFLEDHEKAALSEGAARAWPP